ncbi:recombinase RecA [Methanocella sp. CWC-04]|uniref:Recombinase RecA n=2 Tax=Methanooceanicella nereidis TaxID=2052831 RepID=A0AAP2RE30_9EURY|nr:recombinase RecA [Methanocella sp. CWC-04]
MHKYYLGLKELDEAIGGISGGANIMLIGPPMSGKDSILNNIIAAGLSSEEGVIFLTTKVPGESVIEKFSGEGEGKINNIGIVDCISKSLGLGSNDTPSIKRATSPVDLTGIGVRISQFIEEFGKHKNIKDVRLCINSLSTILMYSNLQTVFRFMHVFSGRVTAIKALGVYVVEEGMHDEQTISTLKQLFNGVIEVKVENDSYYMRAAGLTPRPTRWFEYEVVNDMAVIRGVKDD